MTRDWLDEQMDAADHDCDVRNAWLEDQDDPEPVDDGEVEPVPDQDSHADGADEAWQYESGGRL